MNGLSLTVHQREAIPKLGSWPHMASRARHYADGSALQRHATACHAGVEDSSCPACRELRAKLEAAKC